MTEQQLSGSTAGSSQSSEVWRQEIHARVAGYRSRRAKRGDEACSLRFAFPPAEASPAPPTSQPAEQRTAIGIIEAAPVEDVAQADESPVETPFVAAADVAELPPAVTADENQLASAVLEDDTEAEPELLTPRTPRPQPRRKVIAFPRPAVDAAAMAYRLADPVSEQPRILDVPEELEAFPTTPLLEGLHLPHPEQANAVSPDHIELPVRAVTISLRLYAGVVDALLVAAAAAIFAAISHKLQPQLTPTRPVLLASAGVICLLWAAYQYLLTIYAGTTAGMRVAKICFSTFEGEAPSLRRRRSRVFGLYFSTASLLMGLFWSLVDVDALCWHDRISRTYLTHRE